MNNEIKIQPSKGNNKVEISNNFVQYFEQLAKKHADDAKESELLAKDWANKLGSTVDDTEYSSKYYALKSKEEHDGAVEDIATAKTELEQSIATGLEDYNTNAQAKSESLQTQFDTSISDIKKQEITSINAVKTTQTTAESSITELKTSAELTITNGMADITSNKEQSMSAINENRETSLAEIESAKSGAVSAVNTTKDNAVSTVKQTGTDEYNKILSTGIDSKLGENLITNCLKEVPQRIKYTLENGTLTIKAGSVVIVPYGTEDKTVDLPKGATFINENYKVYDTQFSDGKFFVWGELRKDLDIITNETISLTGLLIGLDDNNGDGFWSAANFSSGSSFPSSPQNTDVFYHVTNNRVYFYNQSQWVTTDLAGNDFLIFPPIKFTGVNKQIVSVDQVFNGMGYIGSTIWLDKGVKGLIPNGRNADGTLKNIEYTSNKISTSTFTGGYVDTFYLRLAPNGTLPNYSTQIRYNIKSFSDAPTPTVNKWYAIYVEDENMLYYSENGGAYYKNLATDLGVYSTSANNKITSFTPKLPFRAADENDIDGKWVRKSLHIINGETAFPLGSQKYRDYDISNYLPNDGHIYELALEILAFSGSETNATSHWWVSDAVAGGQTCSCGGRAYSKARDQQYANGIILMASRTLRLYCSSTVVAPTIAVFRVYAYRKVR